MAHEAPVYLNLIDDRNELIYANRRALTFLGRSLEDIGGHGWKDHHHPDDLPRTMAIFEDALRKQQSHEVEYRVRRHDGEYRWVREVAVARFGPDGKFLGFVCATEDITDARAAREELARQREALHQSEKLSALGSLLAGVAHELNNPLSVVAGQAQLLGETAMDAKTAERAEMIRAAADSCAKIVRSFLAMARRRPPERRAVEINRIVESALEVLGYSLRTTGVNVELELARDLPTTWADGDQLQQVVANLVVNAQQAMAAREGPRRLRIATRFDAATRQLRLEVEDNGPGVPAEIRSRIFEPFFTTKSVGVGTGIGLSLCHNIVESHGGTVALEDAAAGGARFVVVLPHVAPQEPDDAAAAPGDPAAPGPRPRILVVEDEPSIARTLADILEAAGYDVDIAADGNAALQHIGRRTYGLVVSDLRMPGLDGPGLYRALQARSSGWPRRMIFVTGDTLSQAAAAFLAEANCPCIEKPFNVGEVRRIVGETLAEAEAARGA
jgi:PAS domain S-box-containing protein